VVKPEPLEIGWLVMDWLEEEGERLRREIVCPLRVAEKDLACVVCGRVHLGACLLVGTLVAGLSLCGVARAWGEAGSLRQRLQVDTFDLEGVRVMAVLEDSKPGDGTDPLTLLVEKDRTLAVCVFRDANSAHGAKVGDTIWIWSARPVPIGDTVWIGSNRPLPIWAARVRGFMLKDCNMLR
jgi:hypothetical protein